MKPDSKPRVLALLLLFAGGTLSARAAAPQIEPSRRVVEEAPSGDSHLKESHFIGHYGETFSYSGVWVLKETFLRDAVEVVRFHAPEILPDPDSPPRDVRSSDFEKVENFTTLRLSQLLVIPHQDPGFDLEALRARKAEELRSQGATFEVQDAPMPVSNWPKNTFQVYVTAPYRLHQVYAASEDKLYIFTGGLDEEKGSDRFFSVFFAGEFVESLGRYFERLQRVPSTPPPESFDFLDGFARFVFLPLFAAGLLLLGLPWKKEHTRPFAAAAFSAALLGAALHAGGFYLARALSSAGRPGLIAPGVVGWILVPLILGTAYSRTRGMDGARRWGVRAFSVLAALVLVDFGMDTQRRIAGGVPAAADFSVFMCWVGVLCGACYGLSRNPPRKSSGAGGILALAFLLTLLRPDAAPAQDLQDELEAKITVGKRSQDGKLYEALAEKEMREQHRYFEYQRIEITGIIAADDTNKFAPGMFNRVLHPSRNDDGSDVEREGFISSWRRLLRKPNNARKDIHDLFDTKTGKLSPRAREILEPLMDKKNVHVKEIVAHSWGAVLLNVAIREGLINPPEHIIVVGVPDSDLQKWALLAKSTGTKVDIVTANKDLATQAAEYADNLYNLDILGKERDYSNGKAHEAWSRWERSRSNQRIGEKGELHVMRTFGEWDMSNPSGHDRGYYYDTLKSEGLMQYTADSLAQAQTRVLATRAQELMEADIQREVRRIRRRRGIIDEDPPPAAPPSEPPCESVSLGGQRVCVSRPPVPVDTTPAAQPARPAQPQPRAAPVVAQIPFPSIFPRLKSLAQAACVPGADITLEDALINSPPIYFSKEADDRAAGLVSAGIGGCEKLVFARLIEVFRNGQNRRISATWIRKVAAEYTPPPIYSTPQRREEGSRPRPCPPCVWIDGVRACPADC